MLVKPVVPLLDRSRLQLAVAEKFKDILPLTALECPANQETSVGSSFACVATLGTAVMPITVTGAGMTVDWKADRRMYKAAVIEAQVGAWASAQLTGGGPASAECGDEVIIFGQDHTSRCKVTAPGVPPAEVLVEAAETGPATWKWLP